MSSSYRCTRASGFTLSFGFFVDPSRIFYGHSAGQWNFSADIRPAEYFCGGFVADLFSADFRLYVKLKIMK